jgi:hypothetical protein
MKQVCAVSAVSAATPYEKSSAREARSGGAWLRLQCGRDRQEPLRLALAAQAAKVG